MYSENQQDFENSVKEIRVELNNYTNSVKYLKSNTKKGINGYVFTDWAHYTEIMKQLCGSLN